MRGGWLRRGALFFELLWWYARAGRDGVLGSGYVGLIKMATGWQSRSRRKERGAENRIDHGPLRVLAEVYM